MQQSTSKATGEQSTPWWRRRPLPEMERVRQALELRREKVRRTGYDGRGTAYGRLVELGLVVVERVGPGLHGVGIVDLLVVRAVEGLEHLHVLVGHDLSLAAEGLGLLRVLGQELDRRAAKGLMRKA